MKPYDDQENYEEFDATYDPRRAEKVEHPPIEIPEDRLSPEAIGGVIENFILREGTDYGAAEASYETKAQQVRKQLQRGDIKIIFDPNSETVTLMTASQFKKLSGIAHQPAD